MYPCFLNHWELLTSFSKENKSVIVDFINAGLDEIENTGALP